jgi:hemerythrin-like metal-binding protein
MKTIEWREEFSIGIPEVDHEHRELIGLINSALSSSERIDAPTQLIVISLGEIYARVSAHFALEERVMKSLDYDQYAEHKRDHERLLDDIRDIMDDCESSAIFDRDQFAERLTNWFGTHFRTHDARFHGHLTRASRAAPRSRQKPEP